MKTKIKIYELLSRCVMDGIYNVGHATESKLNEKDVEKLHLSIMREITEYIDLGGNEK